MNRIVKGLVGSLVLVGALLAIPAEKAQACGGYSFSYNYRPYSYSFSYGCQPYVYSYYPSYYSYRPYYHHHHHHHHCR